MTSWSTIRVEELTSELRGDHYGELVGGRYADRDERSCVSPHGTGYRLTGDTTMDRMSIVLALLAKRSNPIVGTTRLQKLIFLVEHEGGVVSDVGEGFNFKPYRFGPYSEQLDRDFEALALGGYVEVSGKTVLRLSGHDLEHLRQENADFFLSDSHSCLGEEHRKPDASGFPDLPSLFEETNNPQAEQIVYRITKKGADFLAQHSILEDAHAMAIVKIRERYGKKSLIEILRHVYESYPAYTVESEIKDKVTNRGRH